MEKTRFGFYAPALLVAALEVLIECAAGRFGAIKGYVPLSKDRWLTLPKYDLTFISRFDTGKLYARRAAALEAIRLEDIIQYVMADEKLSKLSPEALRKEFESRKAQEIASMNRTREDTLGHRLGQNRCHAEVCPGVRVHLQTVANPDGMMIPVLADDGSPIAESVRIHAIQQSRQYIVKGERKPVNSGAPVRISNAIKRVLNFRSVAFSSYSLKNNFDAIMLDGNTLTPDEVQPVVMECDED